MNSAELQKRGQEGKEAEAEEGGKEVKGADKYIDRAAEHVSGADK